ncbi:Hypothetical_protein [Hexamita inflata]|uniref:Hypothetical_protein n=1 Tax=Hexamita inflata TaxID=28002 RepID=A0AA86UEY7_9EUKA|nr:Hypothetical protein HINF_LOCUS43185 [Hexamita inflata]
MSVLMRREHTLIIEPGSDISKIQIINFILLPNSKKHFEGPPLQLEELVKQQVETDIIFQLRSVPNQDNLRLHHCSSLGLKSTVKIAVHFSIVKIIVYIQLYLIYLLNMRITGYRPVP